MPLVVEGWIDEGEAPIVMVTHVVDLTEDAPSFDDFVEKWGRVTIYDNGRPYILTGHVNKGYTPSLVFTTSRLKGKTGHTYRLTIETEEQYAEAEVTMGDTPEFVSAEPTKEDDGYSITAVIKPTDGPVQFQTQTIGEDGRFYPAFCSTIYPCDIPDDGIRITKGIHAAYSEEESKLFSHYFKPGDLVLVKLCRIPQELYPFWTAYDQSVSLGGNLFLSMPNNCRGNIDGALGYFSASGAAKIAVSIPK